MCWQRPFQKPLCQPNVKLCYFMLNGFIQFSYKSVHSLTLGRNSNKEACAREPENKHILVKYQSTLNS